MKTKHFLIVAFALSLPCAAARAQIKTPPPPIFPTAAPALHAIVVENEYQFLVRQYAPAVEVNLVGRDHASYGTPESAAIAGISAMASGDFEWFRSTWDEASRRILEERDTQLKQDRSFWTKAWERAFTDRRVELTARIETGDYVLIVYRLAPRSGTTATAKSADTMELIVPLKSVNGKWMATQELAADPVLAHWKTPEIRPRRVIRAAPAPR